jgi:hypothetical protein
MADGKLPQRKLECWLKIVFLTDDQKKRMIGDKITDCFSEILEGICRGQDKDCQNFLNLQVFAFIFCK